MDIDEMTDEQLDAHLNEVDGQVEAALAGTTGYDDSVARLEKAGFGTANALEMAALHHGLPSGDVREADGAQDAQLAA